MRASSLSPHFALRYAHPDGVASSFGREKSRLRTAQASFRRCLSSDTPSTEAQLDATSLDDTQPPAKAQRQRVISGIQPTGNLHLGNYLGAIKNWIQLQILYDTFFCVVDMHAITVPQNPTELRKASLNTAAVYIASGIDPTKASIFLQSHVTAHAELFWLLNCATPITWLERMIQYKEKAKKEGADVRAGLLTYPVLMAADILIYQADLVPVGEDQRQHLELTRDIAERVNYLYGGRRWKKRGGRGGRVFKIPEALIGPVGARIMSLTDGRNKMSKSDDNDASRINLLDRPEIIRQKIKRCKTDPYTRLEFANAERPECNNLLGIYELVTGMSRESVLNHVGEMRWGDFKPVLAEAIVDHLAPIQQRYREVMEDEAYLDGVLQDGAEKAGAIAERTLARCYDAMGFHPRQRR